MPASKAQSYKKPIVIGVVIAHVVVVLGIIVALYVNLGVRDLHNKAIPSQQDSAPAQSGQTPEVPQGIQGFFNEDGSIDTNKVNDVLSNVPTPLRGQVSGMLDGHLRSAIDEGSITEEQAAALRQAFREAIEKDS